MKAAALTILVVSATVAIAFAQVGGAAASVPIYVTDHFLAYKAKVAKGANKFAGFGPVQLSDQFRTADYDVVGPKTLLLPADKNGEGIGDPETHLLEYKIKSSKGTSKYDGLAGVRVINQCNDLLIEVKGAVSLLVPTSKDPSDPNDPPDAPDSGAHQLDHFLCYKAVAQKKLADGTKLSKFPKGIQVRVVEQFEDRLYDLKAITKLCNPVDKSGDPVFRAGPNKGAPAPIGPAPIRNPDEHLVCYKAQIAKKAIPQSGCGPAGQPGVKIDPKPQTHTPRLRVAVNNQFGPLRLDTIKAVELCIPSDKTFVNPPPTPVPSVTPTPTSTPAPTPTPNATPLPGPCGLSAPLCDGGCPIGQVCEPIFFPQTTTPGDCGCVPDSDPCSAQMMCNNGVCPAFTQCLGNGFFCFCEARLQNQCVAGDCNPGCLPTESCEKVVEVATGEITCECGPGANACSGEFPVCGAGACPPDSDCLLQIPPTSCVCTR